MDEFPCKFQLSKCILASLGDKLSCISGLIQLVIKYAHTDVLLFVDWSSSVGVLDLTKNKKNKYRLKMIHTENQLPLPMLYPTVCVFQNYLIIVRCEAKSFLINLNSGSSITLKVPEMILDVKYLPWLDTLIQVLNGGVHKISPALFLSDIAMTMIWPIDAPLPLNSYSSMFGLHLKKRKVYIFMQMAPTKINVMEYQPEKGATVLLSEHGELDKIDGTLKSVTYVEKWDGFILCGDFAGLYFYEIAGAVMVDLAEIFKSVNLPGVWCVNDTLLFRLTWTYLVKYDLLESKGPTEFLSFKLNDNPHPGKISPRIECEWDLFTR